MVSRNQGMVVLAFYDGKVVAGAVFLHFGEEAIYKYSASDPQYRHLAATGLILWEAIKWYCRNGFKVIDFGRTELQNEGLRVFKRGFCRNEQVMGYYKYDLIQGKWREDHLTIEKSFTKLVRKLPIPILRIIGSFLYRHIG
jgi:lipid II:glycine glycyltransferase (peptidoglycan interpeptide bridge formation enzyme)